MAPPRLEPTESGVGGWLPSLFPMCNGLSQEQFRDIAIGGELGMPSAQIRKRFIRYKDIQEIDYFDFAPPAGTLYTQTLTATSGTSAAVLSSLPTKVLSVAGANATSFIRDVSVVKSVVSTSIPKLVKAPSMIFSTLVVTAIATVLSQFQRTVSATGTGTASLIRNPTKALIAIATGTVSFIRNPSHVLSIISTSVTSFVRNPVRTFSVIGTSAATLVKTVSKILSTGSPVTFSDDFNRADSTNLGSNWTEVTDCQILSNRFRSGTSFSGMSYWNVAKYVDVEMYGTLGVISGTDPLYFEWRQALASNRNNDATTDANWSGYYLEIIPGTATLKVWKYDGSTATQLGSDLTVTGGLAASDRIKISMVGDTIKVYAANSTSGGVFVQVGSDLTDSTYQSAGRVALALSSAAVGWDDFGGQTIGAVQAIATLSALKVTNAIFNVTATGVVSLIRAPAKIFAIAATGVASLIRSPSRVLSVVATSTATLAAIKVIVRSFSVSGTGTTVLIKQPQKILSVVATGTASVTRTVNKVCSVVANAALTLVRSPSRTLSVTATGTATLSALKVIVRSFSVSATGTASLIRSPQRIFAVSATGVASLIRTPLKSLSVVSSGVVSFVRNPARTFLVSRTGTASVSAIKVIVRTLTVTATGVTSFIRSPQRLLSTVGTSNVTLTVVQTIKRTFTVTSTALTTLIKLPSRTLKATGSGVASLITARTLSKVFSVVGTGVASIRRAPIKVLVSTGAGITTLARIASITFSTTGTAALNLIKIGANQIELFVMATAVPKLVLMPQRVLSTTATAIASLSTHIFTFVGYITYTGKVLADWSGETIRAFWGRAMKPFDKE